MSLVDSLPHDGSAGARAPLSKGVGASCRACGIPLSPRQRVACSGKCRAALSRRGQDQARRIREREILALVSCAEKDLQAARGLVQSDGSTQAPLETVTEDPT